MKKCEHCSKDCSRRIAVKHKGKILMVGTSCSKKFKRARTKDLLRDASLSDAIARRTMSHGGDPSRYELSKEDFNKRFPNTFKEISSWWEPIEFYNWNGVPVSLFIDRGHSGGDPRFALHIADPYSKGIQQGILFYEDVSKAKTPGRSLSVARGYEYNVLGIKNPPKDIKDPDKGKILEWVDEFTAWDPIKKYGLESFFDAVPASSMYSYKKSSPTIAAPSVATSTTTVPVLNENNLPELKFNSAKNQSKSFANIYVDSENSVFSSCSFYLCAINLYGNSSINNANSNEKISGCGLYIDQSKLTNCTIENSNINHIIDSSSVEESNFNNCSFKGKKLDIITGKQDLNSYSGQFIESKISRAVFSGRILFENCFFEDFAFNEIIINSGIIFKNCYFKSCIFLDTDFMFISFLNCNFGNLGLQLDNVRFDKRYPITSLNCIGTIYGASIDPNTGEIKP